MGSGYFLRAYLISDPNWKFMTNKSSTKVGMPVWRGQSNGIYPRQTGVFYTAATGAAQDAYPVGLFTLADPEHLGAACRANALGCGSSIFHCYFLRVFHLSFGLTFYAISFHLFSSSKLFI
jgi:hypothetical protein